MLTSCVLESAVCLYQFDTVSKCEGQVGLQFSELEKRQECRALVNVPLIPVKCRLDVSWNLHQCLVIVISALARHYGDSLPSSGNCQGIFWCV